VIETAEQGQANNWSYALANKVNQEQSQIRAGQLNDQGDFTPVYGTNPVYLKAGSGLNSVEIGYKVETPEPDYNLEVTGLESEYIIGDSPTQLNLTLAASGDLSAELTVFNHHREPLASYTDQMADGEVTTATLTLSKSEPGHHMLVVVLKDQQGSVVDQNTLDFHLTEEATPPPSDDYDFVFPEGMDNYTAGTKVLASDGNIYQCKAFPYSGYCTQWSPSANQYEPAVGSHWPSAWDKLN
jgi:chitin-binding protein